MTRGKKGSRPRALLQFVLSLAFAGAATAHPLAPALLELRETAPELYEVQWRTSVTRAQRGDVAPVLPETCRDRSAVRTALEDNEALTARWRVHCAGGLAGQALAVRGLDGSGIQVILRVEPLAGAATSQLLDAAQPSWTVPPAPTARGVLREYFALGGEHLLFGFDHVLFIAGLVLLVRRLRPLIVTVTAFTAGHSVTLALATLGVVRVDPAVMELGIALSILVLAVQLARPAGAPPTLLTRRPWAAAAAFGLLHGLGFAGALADVGLPPTEIPVALLGFNLGIEAGQLGVVIALLLVGALAQKIAPIGRSYKLFPASSLATYVLGSLAAMWCYERAALLL